MVPIDLDNRRVRNVLAALAPRSGLFTETAEFLHLTLAYLGRADAVPFSVPPVLQTVEPAGSTS